MPREKKKNQEKPLEPGYKMQPLAKGSDSKR